MERRTLLGLPVLFAAEWPLFRGANGDGTSSEAISTQWPPEGPKLLWRVQVGDGYGGLTVASGRLFTIEQRGKHEVAAAYNPVNGRELWKSSWAGEYKSFIGGNGPRSTPAFQNGRLFVAGALGEVRALDAADGRMLWRKDLRDEQGETVRWGNAWSPLPDGDVVYVLPNAKGASVAGLQSGTGKLIWQALDDEQAYTTPMLVELGGKRQLLVVTAERVAGFNPADGKLLWSHPWKTDHGVNVAQPIVCEGNQVLLSAGYGHGCMLLSVSCTGATCQASMVWENKNLKSKFNSPVLWKGFVYGLDEGILACIELKTGARRWKGGRYGFGQLILASGHLVITTEHGEVALVEASPEAYSEKANFRALNGKTWNMPALSDGVLYLRNEREMAAFRIGP